jgi:hypothetical protein
MSAHLVADANFSTAQGIVRGASGMVTLVVLTSTPSELSNPSGARWFLLP